MKNKRYINQIFINSNLGPDGSKNHYSISEKGKLTNLVDPEIMLDKNPYNSDNALFVKNNSTDDKITEKAIETLKKEFPLIIAVN